MKNYKILRDYRQHRDGLHTGWSGYVVPGKARGLSRMLIRQPFCHHK